MKKTRLLLFFLFLFAGKLFAQEKTVQGIVFDRDSKQRLTRVYIYNTTTGKGFYNNSKGEFSTTARSGDLLVAALQSYNVDTIRLGEQNTVLFYLKNNSILLREVKITDSLKTPKGQLAETKKEYKDAYTKGTVKDVITQGGSSGNGGAGLSINALYNLLSREGRNARQLQRIIERDYHEAMIDYRYNDNLVNSVTGLQGEKLQDFIQQYRPSYNFAIEANDYELIKFIRQSYDMYQKNPSAFRLPPLKPADQ